MATSRPQRPMAGEPGSLEWYGRLVQRLGGGLAVAALFVAVTSAAALGLPAAPDAAASRLVTVAAADPATLSTLAAVCHYGLLGAVVGTWFLGLGFILTGFLE